MPSEPPIIISFPICVTEKYNSPCLELRKIVTDIDVLKYILSCAFHERTLLIMPKFSDKNRGLSSLQEKGIIYLDKKEKKFYFNI